MAERVGGNKRGQALSFCSKDEEALLAQIEEYTGEEITRYDIHPDEYQDIIFDADDPHYNWKKLIEDNEDPNAWADK